MFVDMGWCSRADFVIVVVKISSNLVIVLLMGLESSVVVLEVSVAVADGSIIDIARHCEDMVRGHKVESARRRDRREVTQRNT